MSFIKDFLQNKGLTGEEQKVTCKKCGHEDTAYELHKSCGVCTECGAHYRLTARDRISMLTDKHSFHELFTGLTSKDFLHFPMYQNKLDKAKESTMRHCFHRRQFLRNLRDGAEVHHGKHGFRCRRKDYPSV